MGEKWNGLLKSHQTRLNDWRAISFLKCGQKCSLKCLIIKNRNAGKLRSAGSRSTSCVGSFKLIKHYQIGSLVQKLRWNIQGLLEMNVFRIQKKKATCGPIVDQYLPIFHWLIVTTPFPHPLTSKKVSIGAVLIWRLPMKTEGCEVTAVDLGSWTFIGNLFYKYHSYLSQKSFLDMTLQFVKVFDHADLISFNWYFTAEPVL